MKSNSTTSTPAQMPIAQVATPTKKSTTSNDAQTSLRKPSVTSLTQNSPLANQASSTSSSITKKTSKN